MTYFPEVVQAVAAEDRTIYIYFSDGRITRFDVKPLIREGGIFRKLEDEKFFSEGLTVLNNTAAWDLSGRYDPTDCIDIDPLVLYQAEIVSDPLDEEKAG